VTASWHDRPLASFDIESTGLDVHNDRIVTAALVRTNGQTLTWMADPGIEIPTAASDIHHVTTAYARKHGQRAGLVVEEIADAIAGELSAGDAALVVMNAPFDLPMLDAECARHGVPTVADRVGRVGPVVDPLVLDRTVDKYRKGGRKLEALAAHYGVELTAAHSADADAQAALGVARAIADKFPQLQVPADVLHAWQVTWYARWADGNETYRRKTDPAFTQSRHWPLTPAAIEATT
jgi:DNA polymerase III, epsilon subunit and related 3''-5'' exonucleases